MANESMTVEQACEKIASVAKEMHESDYGEVWSMAFEVERCNKAVLAAHKREIADFQRRYNECVCKFNEVDADRCRIREEVAAKDAEIAELRECLREAVEWSCGNPDEACEDCVAHGGDTPCKCEKWRNVLEATGGVE